MKNEEFANVVERGRTESEPMSERVDISCMNFLASFLGRVCSYCYFRNDTDVLLTWYNNSPVFQTEAGAASCDIR